MGYFLLFVAAAMVLWPPLLMIVVGTVFGLVIFVFLLGVVVTLFRDVLPGR